MSEKMTRIQLPGGMSGNGLMDWGELTAEDMIRQLRALAAHHRKQAEEIEAAADEDFQVDIIRGPHAQHFIRTVQASRLLRDHPQHTRPADCGG